MPFKWDLPRLASVTCAMLILCSAAHAQIPVFKIADTSTPIPGGNGETFRSFDPPAADRQFANLDPMVQLSFRATGPNGYEGIFKSTGPYVLGGTVQGGVQLQTIADLRTPMPGFTGNFSRFSRPSIRDGYLIAFVGHGDDPAEQAVYTKNLATLSLVAKHGDPRDGGGTFDQFSDPSLGVGVSFRDGSGASQGIFRQFYSDATEFSIRRLVGVGDPIPGSSATFAQLGIPNSAWPSVYSGRNQDGSVQGIYMVPSRALADTNTPIPGGSGTFTGFSDPVIYHYTAAFKGTGRDGLQGIYSIYTGTVGPLERLMDLTSEPPGYPGLSILELGEPSASNSLAWTAKLNDGRTVVYLSPYGTGITPVYDTTQPLSGKEVISISLGREGAHWESVSFLATFADGSQGIYAAALPEPATGLLLLASISLLFRRPDRFSVPPVPDRAACSLGYFFVAASRFLPLAEASPKTVR